MPWNRTSKEKGDAWEGRRQNLGFCHVLPPKQERGPKEVMPQSGVKRVENQLREEKEEKEASPCRIKFRSIKLWVEEREKKKKQIGFRNPHAV